MCSQTCYLTDSNYVESIEEDSNDEERDDEESDNDKIASDEETECSSSSETNKMQANTNIVHIIFKQKSEVDLSNKQAKTIRLNVHICMDLKPQLIHF